MLKTVGACMVILAASGIGVSYSADLKRRLRELCVVKQMIYMLRGEIKYTKTPLPEAFVHIAVRLPEPFCGFLRSVTAELQKADGRCFGEIWREAIGAALKGAGLSRADKEQLATLGEVLGYLDLEMQIAALELYLEQLEQSITEARKDIGPKQKLCQSLGVAGGIFLVILLL